MLEDLPSVEVSLLVTGPAHDPASPPHHHRHTEAGGRLSLEVLGVDCDGKPLVILVTLQPHLDRAVDSSLSSWLREDLTWKMCSPDSN